jgi:hypothetical protein
MNESKDQYYSDDVVSVDLTTFNAARIWKVYGTLACKGDTLPDRPHRLARLFDVPSVVDVVTLAQLKALAALVPEPPKAPSRSGSPQYGAFNLPQWIAAHGLPVVSQGTWGSGGTRWILNPCPWNDMHTNKAAFIVQLPNGAIAAGCHHHGCVGNDWHALRGLYESDWRAARDTSARLLVSRSEGAQSPPASSQGDGPVDLHAHHALFSQPTEPPWPHCAPDAYYGLAGEIVRIIEPYTESDPVAILGQLLVMVGNAIGRAPYFSVEADRHYPNLFLCLVGATSRGRKGTSAGYPRRLLGEIDPAWKSRVKGGLSSGEGIIWNVRDAVCGHNKKGEEICEDEGESDKRLCILESEFARALAKTGQDGNVLSSVLRQAWDTGDLNTLVSGRSKSPVQATGAHVSVIAHITANELRRTLAEVEAANGFGNRFLWLCVRRVQLLPEGGNYPHKALAPLQQRLVEAIFAARRVAGMLRSDAARLRWREIYATLAEGSPGLVGALTARAEAQVLRLSMLYALCEQSAVIDTPHLEAAYALWQYCDASARYIFGESLGDPLADTILQMLRYAGSTGLTRTDVSAEFGRHVKSAAIGHALALLGREGFARLAVEKTPGRPSERWFACALNAHPCEKSERSELSPSPPAPITRSEALVSHHSLFSRPCPPHNAPLFVCPHGQIHRDVEQAVCVECGEVLDASAPTPAFTEFTAQALWCPSCHTTRPVSASQGAYACTTCWATLGTYTRLEPAPSVTPRAETHPLTLDDALTAQSAEETDDDAGEETMEWTA